jgi:hypothetical protein
MKRAFRKIVGSAVAVFVGCSVGAIATLLLGDFVGLSDFHGEELISALNSRFEALVVIAFPVWALALLPLYVFLPRRSPLWRKDLCTVLGAVSGAAIALGLILLGDLNALLALWIFVVVGAIVGAVTCFFGTATADYFHRVQAIN